MKVVTAVFLAGFFLIQPNWAFPAGTTDKSIAEDIACRQKLERSLARWIYQGTLGISDLRRGKTHEVPMERLVRAARTVLESQFSVGWEPRRGGTWWTGPELGYLTESVQAILDSREDRLDAALEIFLWMSFEDGRRIFFRSQAFEKIQVTLESIRMSVVRSYLPDNPLERDEISELRKSVAATRGFLADLSLFRKLHLNSDYASLRRYSGRWEFPTRRAPVRQHELTTLLFRELGIQLEVKHPPRRYRTDPGNSIFHPIFRLGVENGLRRTLAEISPEVFEQLDAIDRYLTTYARKPSQRTLNELEGALIHIYEILGIRQ